MEEKVVRLGDFAPESVGGKPESGADSKVQKWDFLCFLGQIKDNDPALEHLFAMALGRTGAYDKLDPNKKDILTFGGYIDHQGALLPPFQDIAQSCIIQDTNPHGYRLDFSLYQPLIAFMQGEHGSGFNHS